MRLSLACNFDDALLDGLEGLPVYELYGMTENTAVATINFHGRVKLGTVGEPINPEAWMWYHRMIGQEACPIVDTWWQTETGCIMLSPLPGVTVTKPGS